MAHRRQTKQKTEGKQKKEGKEGENGRVTRLSSKAELQKIGNSLVIADEAVKIATNQRFNVSDDEEEGVSKVGANADVQSGEDDGDGEGKAADDNEDEGDAFQAIPPKMFFRPFDYNRQIKVSSRCKIHDVVETLKSVLNKEEMNWFETHPQFKHFFHMHRETKHKIMGMWMLLLHTASTSMTKECWFVVNGVPIRYSLREVGLISGLNCKDYPENYPDLGNENPIKECLGISLKSETRIKIRDVESKLKSMKGETKGKAKGRLPIAVLYFLASVLVGDAKAGPDGGNIERFLVKAASDLHLCKIFPWGRFVFEKNMTILEKIVTKVSKKMEEDPDIDLSKRVEVFSSFVLPLEYLAFEAIKDLGDNFREAVEGADSCCPRMCKSRFKPCDMKGFSLSDINLQLGTTKEIDSVLVPTSEEMDLMKEMTYDEDLAEYDGDIVTSGWKRILLERKGQICFEEMFKEDVNGRSGVIKKPVIRIGARGAAKASSSKNGLEQFLEGLEERVTGLVYDLQTKLEGKIDDLQSRVVTVESDVSKIKGEIDDLRSRFVNIDSFMTAEERTHEEMANRRRKKTMEEEEENSKKRKKKMEEEEEHSKKRKKKIEEEENSKKRKKKIEEEEENSKKRKKKMEEEEENRKKKRKTKARTSREEVVRLACGGVGGPIAEPVNEAECRQVDMGISEELRREEAPEKAAGETGGEKDSAEVERRALL